jgi:hypothetical protein
VGDLWDRAQLCSVVTIATGVMRHSNVRLNQINNTLAAVCAVSASKQFCNQGVGGSNLSVGTNKTNNLRDPFFRT